MATKVSSKEAAKQLKKLQERTEEWASKAASSFKSTKGLAQYATEVLCRDANRLQDFNRLLDKSSETVLENVLEVSKLASSMRSAVMGEYQKKTSFGRHCKLPSQSQKEMQARVEKTCLDIGMALFESLQIQAQELDRIALQSMALLDQRSVGLTECRSDPTLSMDSAQMSSSQDHWTEDSPVNFQSNSSTQDCDIDWDGFESDLKAMSVAVGNENMPTSATDTFLATHDSLATKNHLREIENEKEEAINRAKKAEARLQELERVHNCSLEKFSTFYSEDDISELRGALKQEQVARLGLESELREAKANARAAQDDSKAARFALSVAQQVAAKMATHRRNPSNSSVDRRNSDDLAVTSPAEGQPQITMRPSASMGSFPVVDFRAQSQEDGEGSQKVESESAQRSDSAFIVGQVSAGNLKSPSTPSIQVAHGNADAGSSCTLVTHGSSKSSNPRRPVLSSRGTKEMFLEESGELYSSYGAPSTNGNPEDLDTNPFLASGETSQVKPRVLNDSNSSLEESEVGNTSSLGMKIQNEAGDHGFNPFESEVSGQESMNTDCAPETHVEEQQESWNPFNSESGGEAPISAKTESQQDAQASWNPFTLQSTTDVDNERGNEESKDNVAWNPFESQPDCKNAGDGSGETGSRTGEKACKDSWNPFVSKSSGGTQQEGGKEGEGWNPFMEEQRQEAAVTTNKDGNSAWNPFA